ncbi:TlpA family protein disulfide reductase [Bizionia sediminis]|uniref:TlpA family protein disulfide reductase n=1 Tax=Bizionia sediminis TaxID=1737064 RepID=A0ABW5KYD8_9FLAO
MILTFIYFKNKKIKVLLYSIILFLILVLIGMLFENNFSKGMLYLIFIPLVFYLTKKSFNKKLLLPLILIIIIFNSFFIFPNYFEFVLGTYHPKSIGVKINQISFTDKYGNLTQLDEKKIIVIDFWNTSCGACFKKFPKFNELTKKYQNYDNISFYAINVPTERDKNLEDISKKIESLNYSFNKLYAVDQKEIEKILDFNLYPKIFLIENGKVINTKLKLNEKEIIINNLEYELKKTVANNGYK